ncbi:hypothetical protein A2U01_0104919, partial [Trifolium medium]|nr:hypothetical protein [Trifolium medium]
MVDGELIEVKIIEEWGLALGEDACLRVDLIQRHINLTMRRSTVTRKL